MKIGVGYRGSKSKFFSSDLFFNSKMVVLLKNTYFKWKKWNNKMQGLFLCLDPLILTKSSFSQSTICFCSEKGSKTGFW